MNQEQKQSYLKRIGFEKVVTLDRECLEDLMWAHLTHVPFENLDIYDLKQVPSLEEEAIYEKIVVRHRGGYCYETNALFYQLLKSCGFDCYPVAVRIFRNPDVLPNTLHRATIVELDGEKCFCDIGFGGPGPRGVLVLKEGEQTIREKKFHLVTGKFGLLQIEREQDGNYIPLFCFDDVKTPETDFNLMNFYSAKNEDSLFMKKRILNLCTDTGSLALTDNTFTERKNGQVTTQDFTSDEERKACISDRFNILF